MHLDKTVNTKIVSVNFAKPRKSLYIKVLNYTRDFMFKRKCVYIDYRRMAINYNIGQIPKTIEIIEETLKNPEYY